MLKYLGFIVFTVVLSGCVSQTIQKVTGVTPETEICVVKNKYVRDDFFDAYRNTLHNAGFKTKEIVSSGECSVYTTYTAEYGMHWGVYLARANLRFYRGDELIGSATYKAPRADPSKHGRVEGKLQKLVDSVFSSK